MKKNLPKNLHISKKSSTFAAESCKGMNEQSPKIINADAQLVNDAAYQTLVENISKAVELAHQKLATAVNTILIDTNWEIGRYIVEFEQHGNARAKYGDNLINRLSKDLTIRLGKGYSKSNLLYIRKFYYTFAKDERLSHLFARKGTIISSRKGTIISKKCSNFATERQRSMLGRCRCFYKQNQNFICISRKNIVRIWEKVNNPDFNYGEFATIRNNAGSNNLKISMINPHFCVEKWKCEFPLIVPLWLRKVEK